MLRVLIAFSMLFGLVGCRPRMHVQGADGIVYTQTNMHAARNGQVSSVNYTGTTRIPICTPVRIGRINARQMRFTNAQTGQRYVYVMHRSARTPIDQHVQRYFGTGCPDISTMSPEDQSGIQSGQVYQGMTKQGVIMAVGYPPEHRTQSLNEDVWRYWRTRMGSYEVYFSNGLVSGIRQ